MAQPVIQTAFHAGELAPTLYGRVDLAKYKAAAALLRNFFVDYRGGASSRMGTKYVIQARISNEDVRLIPFQASFDVSYVLEFGDGYVRFINNGSPVLEPAKSIINITNAAAAVVTVNAHLYSSGDIIFISGATGMPEINGRYYRVGAVVGQTFTILTLFGQPVNSTAYGNYTGNGLAARVYTIASPYDSDDLDLLKFALNVDRMVLTHPDYVPYELRLIAPTNWTLTQIAFGSSVNAPAQPVVTSTLGPGNVWYSYIVTAIDANGEESVASAAGPLQAKTDLRTTAGTNTVTVAPVAGAVGYNVYKAEVRYAEPVPTGSAYGYIGSMRGTVFHDSNIAPDFSDPPPVAQNPFRGRGINSYVVGANGNYQVVPTVTVAPPPPGGSSTSATATAVLGVTTTGVAVSGGGYTAGDVLTITGAFGAKAVVATVDGGGGITSFQPMTHPQANMGYLPAGAVPADPRTTTGGTGAGAEVNLIWGVIEVNPVSYGAGYDGVSPPLVSFAPVSITPATATAVVGVATVNDPSVPAFFQQRLVLGGLQGFPQTFYMSQPGYPYNFNISPLIQPDDAISGSIVSGQLNTIKAFVSMPTGLITLSDKAAWLINAGESNAPVTPINIVANPHSYNGCSDVPPIVANFDILYVQSKGSIVRDLTYNFYANIFTGTDISVLSSHLFYGYQVTEWAWAEEPYKVVWAVRNDGVMLTLTFLKEQELVGWSHSDTQGLFKSVCTVTEPTDFGPVDAVYVVVERQIGDFVVKFIERFAERIFPFGAASAWCVDSALQYVGAPATSFSGLEHLQGMEVTGLADGTVIEPFVVPQSGTFTLPTPASIVTVGLSFTPQVKTLPMDLGEPTAQGKRKKVTAVTLKVVEALGLKMGKTLETLTVMKDLVIGNIGSMSNEEVTNLVTGEVRTVIDPQWDVFGAYYIEQPLPYPVTLLAVIPEVIVGDTAK